MTRLLERVLPTALLVLFVPALCAQTAGGATPVLPPAGQGLTPDQTKAWPGYGRDAQHGATATVRSQALNQIRWSTPVDQNPQYSSGNLLIHYGSPMATRHNTLVLPVKTGASGGFTVQGRSGTNGALKWTGNTDYIWPVHNWGPSMGCTLTPSNTVAIPAAGGTILVRSDADQVSGTLTRECFFGLSNYNAHVSTYNANVYIDTPITADAAGNLYFGFQVTGPTSVGLVSGLARIDANGSGSWISAANASGDASMLKVTYNCAPALSRDGTSVYVTVNDEASSGFGFGYLLRLSASTLALQSKVRLKDADSGSDAFLADDGTASPCVGPDGDVYIGVLENPFPNNNDRGWMLHYNATLSTTKRAGAFGWDDTASVVPATAVPSYAGSSSYLLVTKYNNYAGIGGDGVNKIAVLDPNGSMTDPVTGTTVMKEVITVTGPTPDPNWIGSFPNAVHEWCINTAAVDPLGHSALLNSEDGTLYRWDFVTNTLSESIVLTAGIGEAYTPTIVGPDGTVYAISNARLYAIGN